MRRRSFYKDDGKYKTAILRKTEERESEKEVKTFNRFECRKCGKIVPRGLYMHEKYCDPARP